VAVWLRDRSKLMSVNAVPSVAGGGEPPYDGDMDKRLTVLETRFDTILPTLATKSDVEALRAEVHVGFEKFCGEFRSENQKLRCEFGGENEKLRSGFGNENEELRGEFRGENEKLRREFRTESEKLRGEFRTENERLRGEFRTENEKLRGEFRAENEKLRGEFLSGNEKLRADMEKHSVDFQKALHDNTKFMIGIMASMFIGLLAVNIAVFNVINNRLTSLESKFSTIQQGALSAPPSPPALRQNAGAR
jgi:hypothetical protein